MTTLTWRAFRSDPSLRPAWRCRLLLLAHAYTPIFSLVVAAPASRAIGSGFEAAIVAATYAVGGLGFVVAKPFAGLLAERRGNRAAIRLGLTAMIVSTLSIAIVLFLLVAAAISDVTTVVGILAMQLLLGAGLACIEGADRDILKSSARCRGDLDDHEEHAVQSIDWVTRFISVAIGAIIGALAYSITEFVRIHGSANLDRPTSITFAGGVAFTLTAALQISALVRVSRLPGLEDRGKAASLGSGIAAVRHNPQLFMLVALAAMVDGWLLFLSSFLSIGALKRFLSAAPTGTHPTWIHILTIVGSAAAFGALASIRIIGALVHRHWFRSECAMKGATAPSSQRQLSAAFFVLSIGIVSLIGFLVITIASEVFGTTVHGLVVVGSVLIFAIMEILRGFVMPLLYGTVDRSSEADFQHSVRSIASFGARGIQLATAAISLAATAWLGSFVSVAGHSSRITLTVSATMLVVLLVLIGPIMTRGILDAVRRLLADASDAIRHAAMPILYTGFFASLVGANVTASTAGMFEHGAVAFNWGAFQYVLAFFFVDACLEIGSKRHGITLYLFGIAANTVCAVLMMVLSWWYPTLSVSAWIFLASTVSFSAAQFFEVQVYCGLKATTSGGAVGSRFLISSFVAQAVDTILFVPLSMVGGSYSTGSYEYLTGQLTVKWTAIVLLAILYEAAIRPYRHRSPEAPAQDLERSVGQGGDDGAIVEIVRQQDVPGASVRPIQGVRAPE